MAAPNDGVAPLLPVGRGWPTCHRVISSSASHDDQGVRCVLVRAHGRVTRGGGSWQGHTRRLCLCGGRGVTDSIDTGRSPTAGSGRRATGRRLAVAVVHGLAGCTPRAFAPVVAPLSFSASRRCYLPNLVPAYHTSHPNQKCWLAMIGSRSRRRLAFSLEGCL